MPVIDADGCPIHVEVEGPDRAPVLMLSNSLGTTLAMWDGQVKPFTQHFRLVRYDRRGHGKSGAPKGPYTMERLGRDVLAVLDGLGIKKINWCGLSMGGMVGQWLGANAPDRVERMVLSNTSSFFPDKSGWNDRLKLVEEKGVPAFAAPNMARWFTSGGSATRTGGRGADPGHVRRHPARGLPRLRRRGPRHGPSRDCCRRSRRRPWSSPDGTTEPLRPRRTSTSAKTFPAPSTQRSTPLTSPMSNSQTPTPTLCWVSSPVVSVAVQKSASFLQPVRNADF